MKKILILLCVMCLGLMSGCGDDSKGASGPLEPMEGIDVDLAAMDELLAYTESCNMVVAPANYVGKVIRLTGEFHVEGTSEPYSFTCHLEDSTGCCSQEIAFELEGDHAYPDDYPKKGSKITVIGEFAMAQDGKTGILKNATLME